MERSLDYKGRWRNHTVAFRVSDEEAKLLNDLVALSGLTKQEYIIRRLTCRDVVVQGNPRVYKALKNQMAAIHEELKRLETVSPDNDELLYTLQVINVFLTEDRQAWEGTATELVKQLPDIQIQANVLSRRLNTVNSQLLNDYGIFYDNKRGHERKIILKRLEVKE